MSADNKPTTNRVSSNTADPLSSSNAAPLQSDLEQIRFALEQTSESERGELTSAKDLKELMQSLDHANGVAGDVEGKLDDLLGNLDALLNSLEEQHPDGQPKQDSKS